MKFKNEQEHRTSQLMYELVVDMGDSGTATIFSHHKQDVVDFQLEKFMNGELEDLDIDEDELEDVVGVSVQMTLEAPKGTIQIVTYGGTEQVMVELFSAEVDK